MKNALIILGVAAAAYVVYRVWLKHAESLAVQGAAPARLPCPPCPPGTIEPMYIMQSNDCPRTCIPVK